MTHTLDVVRRRIGTRTSDAWVLAVFGLLAIASFAVLGRESLLAIAWMVMGVGCAKIITKARRGAGRLRLISYLLPVIVFSYLSGEYLQTRPEVFFLPLVAFGITTWLEQNYSRKK